MVDASKFEDESYEFMKSQLNDTFKGKLGKEIKLLGDTNDFRIGTSDLISLLSDCFFPVMMLKMNKSDIMTDIINNLKKFSPSNSYNKFGYTLDEAMATSSAYAEYFGKKLYN